MFEMNDFNGHGVVSYKNGCVYDGYFQENEFDGFGEMSWPDKFTYKGQWNKDIPAGTMTLFWFLFSCNR